jgi:hypothetical protein
VAEPGNPIACNRYAYVYNAPVHYTDSSGHFIDTLWDVVDLGADALNCLGDSDTLACYMLIPDALALALPFVPGVADNAIKAARRVEDAHKPIALVKSGVGHYNPSDLEAITRFSARAALVNEERSFKEWWATFAQYGITDKLWVYRSGDEIVGAMRISGPKTVARSASGEAIVALELGELESIRKGAGISLLKEGIYESKRLGLEGRIFYVSAPNPKTLAYHTYLARVTGADFWTNSFGTFFYYDRWAAENLLSKPINLR